MAVHFWSEFRRLYLGVGYERGMHDNQANPANPANPAINFAPLLGIRRSPNKLGSVTCRMKKKKKQQPKAASIGAGLGENEAYTARDRERENGNERRIIGRTSQRMGVQHFRNTYWQLGLRRGFGAWLY